MKALSLLLVSAACAAATLEVPGEHATIQAALDAAVSGDIVRIAAGDYDGAVVLKDGVSLVGAGAEATTLRCSECSAVVRGANGARIEEVTIAGDAHEDIDGVLCENVSEFAIERAVIRDCSWSGVAFSMSSGTIRHSIIAGNRCAGIFCSGEPPGEIRIENCTICENQNEAGVNAWNGAAAAVTNCILWANGHGAFSCSEGTITEAWNDVDGSECAVGPDDISADPCFRDAAAGDYRLGSMSPCIDAGDPSSPLDPDGTRADIGAVFHDQRIPFIRGDSNRDGRIDVADAIRVLSHLFLSARLACPNAADGNADLRLDVADAVYVLQYLFARGDPPPAPFPAPGIYDAPGNPGCRE